MLKKKMSKAVKGLTAIVLAAACMVNTGVTTYAASGYSGDYYGFDLNYHESAKCEKADGWSNGDMFRNCTWRAGNVNFHHEGSVWQHAVCRWRISFQRIFRLWAL